MRVRVVVALCFLAGAKVINIYVPILYKHAVDTLSPEKGGAIAVPVMIIVAYAVARVLNVAFSELRDAVFAKVGQRAIRTVALKTFRHLHALALRFHLERQTGGLSRVIERGTKGIETLLVLHAVQHPADLDRDRARMRRAVELLQRLVRAGHVRHDRRLYRLHDGRHRMAHQVPPDDERDRQRGVDQGDRQPLELRDGQVFRQRGARGAPLRSRARSATSAPRSGARAACRCSTSARGSSSPAVSSRS